MCDPCELYAEMYVFMILRNENVHPERLWASKKACNDHDRDTQTTFFTAVSNIMDYGIRAVPAKGYNYRFFQQNWNPLKFGLRPSREGFN